MDDWKVVEMQFKSEFFEIMSGNFKETVSKRLDYLWQRLEGYPTYYEISLHRIF